MKNEKIKKSTKLSHKKNNFPLFIKKKIEYYQKIIIRTILIVQKYKTLDILGASELNVCINNLKEIFNESNNDNGVDIGAASFRYKDLYLGGGIHLGGTGSANKLEDYEEGTWTPRLHGTTTGDGTAASRIDANGAYDYYKIGRVVFVNWYFSAQSTSSQMSGDLSLSGLPSFLFTNKGKGTPHTLCLDTHQSGLVSIIDLSLD